MSDTAIVKYGGWNAEQVAADAEAAAKQLSEWHTFSEGDTRIRVLPCPVPTGKPIVAVHQHNFKWPGRKNNTIINCRNMMAGERCPVCEAMNQLKKSPDQEKRTLAEELFPKFRAFGNIAIRKVDAAGNVVGTDGPKKCGFGKKVFEKFLSLRRNPDYGDITDPSDDGVDITITRKGTGKNDTSYDATPSRRASGLGDLSMIDRCEDLSPMGRVPSYAEAMAAFKGENQPQDGGGSPRENDVTPPRGRSVSDDLQRDKADANRSGAVPADSDIPF